jgi:hypothetical protein
MNLDVVLHQDMKKIFTARGAEAARLRQHKYQLVRKFHIPEEPIGGSLALTYTRCGKPNCWCAKQDGGHPQWLLTFMLGGKKHVVRIPEAWVEQLRPLVEAARQYKDATSQVFAANARLVALLLQRERRSKKR